MTTSRQFWRGVLSAACLWTGLIAGDLTNDPPLVRLNSPQPRQVFSGATDIPLAAYARDAEDGFNLKVEFFAGTHSLGFGTFAPTRCASPWCPNFSLVWSNVAAGEYTVTAIATDSQGSSGTSEPAAITVLDADVPSVRIFATDSYASEISPLVDAAPDTATFVVRRTGRDLADPLTVFYQIGGTASNGLDYDALPGQVTIPANADTAEIVINPIDDALAEGTETVELKLTQVCPPCVFLNPPCLPPIPTDACYFVGFPGAAIAFIHDNETANQRPEGEVVEPHNGGAFPAFADIEIDVKTRDLDGWVHRVEFFADDKKIGEAFIDFIVAPPPGMEQMFSLVWTNVATGRHRLAARVIDDLGAASLTAPISVTVGDVIPEVPIVGIVAIDPYASESVSTNGTNTASFRIFRSDPTNLDLSVFYSIHGTASNGVDYRELSGPVTIRAGRRSTRITIVPVQDELAEGSETVVLRLEPDPSAGPMAHYQIGQAEKAAAILVDDESPTRTSFRLPDGSFHLGVPRPAGFAFRVEVSEDLSTWLPVCTNSVTDGAVQFVDPDGAAFSRRFYRIIPEPDYAPDRAKSPPRPER